MNLHFRQMMVLAFGATCLSVSHAQDSMTFQVKGGNPGGVGGYNGEVTLTKLGKATAKIRWVAGENKQVTEGFAIKTDAKGKAIGTGYGPGLYALAVYEKSDKGIHATWALATKPEESGTYELKGTAFEGALSFADGTPGTVTFTPGKDGVFKMVWTLPTGRYEGIGLQRGDVLVAASGDLAQGFGIGAYGLKGEAIEGRWLTTQTETPGTEIWTVPGLAASTTGTGIAGTPPAPKKAEDDIPPGLVKAIKADMDKCVVVAEKFVGFLKAGETEKAVGLLSDSAFTKVSRESFLQAVQKSDGVFGALKSYKPDRGATNFGMKDGVMTFTFQADAEYANGQVRETLKFIRNDKGEIEFVGYNRTAKE